MARFERKYWQQNIGFMVLAMTARFGSSSKTTEKGRPQPQPRVQRENHSRGWRSEETGERPGAVSAVKASGEKLVIGTWQWWHGMLYAEAWYYEE